MLSRIHFLLLLLPSLVPAQPSCPPTPTIHALQAYLPDAPAGTPGAAICGEGETRTKDARGTFSSEWREGVTELKIDVTIVSSSTCSPLPSSKTLTTIWHASPSSTHTITHPPSGCRGSYAGSSFTVSTVVPGNVGALNGLGPLGIDVPPYSPKTVQVVVEAKGYRTLVTEVQAVIQQRPVVVAPADPIAACADEASCRLCVHQVVKDFITAKYPNTKIYESDTSYKLLTDTANKKCSMSMTPLIVAHGVGACTALRVAEKHKLHSVYLVAPSRMDGDEAEFAWQAVAENVKAFHGLLKGGEDEFERKLRGELGHGKWEVVKAEAGWEDCEVFDQLEILLTQSIEEALRRPSVVRNNRGMINY